jgi:chromosome segregation ATPase
LNKAHINAKQLFNLLESGGFPNLSSTGTQGKGSSFQVIRQGEVQELATKGEAGFLRLLETVAGTSIFDYKLAKMDVSL